MGCANARKLNGIIDAIADGLRAPGLQQRLNELEARRVQLEQGLATEPTTPVRLHPNLAQVSRRQVERLQDALNEPDIRDGALQILRGLIDRVAIGPAENGLEVEIVGEIAKMVELGIGNTAKRATDYQGRVERCAINKIAVPVWATCPLWVEKLTRRRLTRTSA